MLESDRGQEIGGTGVPQKHRAEACVRLGAYLETPRERVLRGHQEDVMGSLRDFFFNGGTAGYISLPTGSGKTVLATELVAALGMRALVLSPTQTILEQTSNVARKLSGIGDISNYYAPSKDLSGKVINTTYQSCLRLLRSGKIDPRKIELLICDEAHTALGEERHTIFRHFPNAIKIGLTATPYFGPLEGYQERGIVDKDEPWVELFTRCIHEMSLEEGMERGVLAPLDVYLLRTNVRVGSVKVLSDGAYNRSEIQRYLRTQGRDFLAVAMIGGLEKVPQGIEFSADQQEELRRIHERIKGKRTVIFGLSIDQIEFLKLRIRGCGVSAEAVHSGVSAEERRRILADHARGNIQVVLGVDMLRLGWDSPPTEVGIFLAPTQSGIVAVQELGRILRPSPETGKDRAIAVQLVDEFRRKFQAPILIPDIFDPSYVLRGTVTGREKLTKAVTEQREKPIVTFSGMQIESIVEEARSAELIRRRFERASILEMNSLIDNLILETREKYPDASVLEFYSRLAEAFPWKVSEDRQAQALQAVASLDSNIARAGKNVLLFLRLQTILLAIEPYLSDEEELNDDIVQAAITEVYARLGGIKSGQQISTLTHNFAERGAARLRAAEENMPMTWFLNNQAYAIKTRVEAELEQYPFGLSKESIEELAGELSSQTGLGTKAIENYIWYKNSFIWVEEGLSLDKIVSREELLRVLPDVLMMLDPREQKILDLRYGLSDGQTHTLTEIGQEFGLIGERIRQIESMALRKLRHPRLARKLKYLLPDLDLSIKTLH